MCIHTSYFMSFFILPSLLFNNIMYTTDTNPSFLFPSLFSYLIFSFCFLLFFLFSVMPFLLKMASLSSLLLLPNTASSSSLSSTTASSASLQSLPFSSLTDASTHRLQVSLYWHCSPSSFCSAHTWSTTSISHTQISQTPSKRYQVVLQTL